jgi:tRNA(Met) C34 N-acetyltransferase TmcA
MGGMGGEGKPSEGKPGGGQSGQSGQGKQGQPPPGGQQPPPGQQNQPQGEARKRIEDATKNQEDTKGNLDKNKPEEASDDAGKAVQNLRDAQKKLEELLKQIREEEIERLLAALQNRCEEMLQKQIQVYGSTTDVFGQAKSNDGKLNREQTQRSNELATLEGEIVKICATASRLVEEEGSAVAFAEVFKQVHADMVKVQKRLTVPDVGEITQNIEKDIIETLKEMIEALKKAQKENQQKKQKPKEQKPMEGQQKPPDQDLIDLLAELKMIRSMQTRVNKRTEDYHKFYPGVEQVPDTAAIKDAKERAQTEMVQQELKNLTDRQDKIKSITADIARGKNKVRD